MDYQPSIVRLLPGGQLMVVFERIDPATFYGDLYVAFSSDNGATWTTPLPAIASPLSERHPALVQLGPSSFVLFYLVDESSNSYRLPIEGSPQGHWTLQQHPLLFELGILLWMAFFCAAILLLPRRPSRIVSLAVVIGHAWGACSWLDNYLGYWGCIALAVVAAAITVLTWEKVAPKPSPGSTD